MEYGVKFSIWQWIKNAVILINSVPLFRTFHLSYRYHFWSSKIWSIIFCVTHLIFKAHKTGKVIIFKVWHVTMIPKMYSVYQIYTIIWSTIQQLMQLVVNLFLYRKGSCNILYSSSSCPNLNTIPFTDDGTNYLYSKYFELEK